MGEGFLRKQAHGFAIQRCQDHERYARPQLLDRLGSDHFQVAYTFDLVRDDIVAEGSRVFASARPDGRVVVVDGAEIVGTVAAESEATLREAVKHGDGFVRMTVETVVPGACVAVIDEDDES